VSVPMQVSAPGVDFRLSLAPLGMLAGDPTIRLEPTAMTRATITPDGPGAIQARWQHDPGKVTLSAWGDGASWLLDRGSDLADTRNIRQCFASAPTERHRGCVHRVNTGPTGTSRLACACSRSGAGRNDTKSGSRFNLSNPA
jgi:hypothetical protein